MNIKQTDCLFSCHLHNKVEQMEKCDHQGQLMRQHRSFLDKMLGVKHVYVCKKCGKRIKLRNHKVAAK